jgi:murein DD-endopeptidase MepM/ murein hydrolase activator NlpD
LKSLLETLSEIRTLQVLDPDISIVAYTSIDLSVSNDALKDIDLGDPEACQGYIDYVLAVNKAKVAYGGYLEQRNLYSGNTNFESQQAARRDIHLGVDFWAPAGTRVVAPLQGEVHSFQNNAIKGDYGPTIILTHNIGGISFHTLYGHLSLESLDDLYVGKVFEQGADLATLGNQDINVHYAPHLHFQLIADLEGKQGDYPGVCRASELQFYKQNCPDPMLLLMFTS